MYTLVMKTVLNVKVDPVVKKEAQRVAQEMNLPLSILVNNYLKEFIRNKEAYFSAHTVNKKTSRLLKSIDQDIKNGKNLSPKFRTAREMDTYLASL